MDHFADRLTEAVRAKGTALCVGLDPRWEALPKEIRRRQHVVDLAAVAQAYRDFCLRVLDIVAPLVPVVKPQSAFFEACGPMGLLCLQAVLGRAHELGLVTILDNKRNDIASTAVAYADAAFDGPLVEGKRLPVWDADALTVNPYLGRDAVEPFIESARRSGRGVFVLVRTSNPGAGMFQDLRCDGQPLYMHVARAVNDWGRENLGRCGYGDVGAVLGATHPAELAQARTVLSSAYLLIPGYGAQGGAAAGTAPAFAANGLGAIVNSSRGIIAAFDPADVGWEARIEEATKKSIRELERARTGRTE